MRRAAAALLFLLAATGLEAKFRPWYNYFNFHYGTKAMSMGNAFTAVADDLTAVFWNPAGLAGRKAPEFHLSFKNDEISHEYEPQSRTDGRFFTESYNYTFDSTLNQIDFFSIAVPARFWNMDWAFALSYYRYLPYGFKGSSIGNYRSVYKSDVTEKKDGWKVLGSEGIDILAFSTAFRIRNFFALGFTLQQFFNTGSIRYDYVALNDTFSSEQFVERIHGRNVIIGCVFQPVRQVRLGYTVHTRLRNEFLSQYSKEVRDKEGNVLSRLDETSKGRVNIPAQYSIGLVISPWPNLNLSLDYGKIFWSKGQLLEYYDYGTVSFPIRRDFRFTQQDTDSRRIGVEAHLPFMQWTVHPRFGVFRDQQLYVDNQGNKVVLKGFALGLGVEPHPSVMLEVSYMHQRGNWPDDSDLHWGDYVDTKFRGKIISLSLTYRFRAFFRDE